MMVVVSVMTLFAGISSAVTPVDADAGAEKLGWRLALQCWTFNKLTTFECIDRAGELGLRYIELFPGQVMMPGSSAKTGHGMSVDDRNLLRQKLIEANIQAINYGVVKLGENEKANRKVFEFAKALGIETIQSEPKLEALDVVAKLADEYGINVALHNHPKPSYYWDPAKSYAAIKDKSPRLGLCLDTEHLMRSGIVPLDAVKKYGDRIKSFHFKDLNEMGKDAHDVPWGTGKGDVAEVLKELQRQGFKGAFSIEYEYRSASQDEEVAACADAFRKMTQSLSDPEEVVLFNGKDLSGWAFSADKVKGTWSVTNGVIHNSGKPNGYIRTEADYTGYILRLQFRHITEGNSGYLNRVQLPDKVWPRCIEVQGQYGNVGDIWNLGFSMKTDRARRRGKRTIKRFDSSERKLGEWNDLQIEMRGGDLKAWVNGVVQTLATECEVIPGKICIQSEGARMEYRNIRLIKLP